jgi:ribosomal protein S27AE
MATTAGRIACPVCGALEYEQVFPVYTGPMLAGDFSPVEDGTLDNRCCRKCGLVFQA